MRVTDLERARRMTVAATALLAAAWVVGCGGTPPAGDAVGVAARGPWLGQTPPGDRAELFAPGIVSTGRYTRDLAVTPEGDEIYFTVMLPNFEFSTILVTRRTGDAWSAPEVAPFSGRYRDLEPALSPDGRRLFFVSYRPADGNGEPQGHTDVWVVERAAGGWGEPRALGPPVNTEAEEFFPSITRDGTIYFTRRLPDGDEAIWRAEAEGSGWHEAQRLPAEVNAGQARFNAYVAPDESFLIVPIFGLEDSLGGTDYYVAFRGEDGSWRGPVHLGPQVNSTSRLEYSASLSPDGRYLFFMSARGSRFADRRLDPPLTALELDRAHAEPGNGNPSIWWIDAGFVSALRP